MSERYTAPVPPMTHPDLIGAVARKEIRLTEALAHYVIAYGDYVCDRIEMGGDGSSYWREMRSGKGLHLFLTATRKAAEFLDGPLPF